MCNTPVTFTVSVDTTDRLAGGSRDSCSVTLDKMIKPISVQLVEATVPLTWYTFKSGNQVIPFQENALAATVATITAGNYSPAALAIEIAARLTAASPNVRTYTGAYNSTTDTMTFTVSAGTFAFLWATSGTDTCYLNLGWTSSSTTQAATQSNPWALKLSDNYVYMRCSPFSTINGASNPNDAGYFAKITLPVNSGAISFHTEGEYEECTVASTVPTNRFDVSISGYKGKSLVMRSDWSFTLRITGYV